MDKFISISGIYPHLAVFNGLNECGIGAVVAWAGKLWYLTYAPHRPFGSTDKLYALTTNYIPEICPDSVGGTPAGRLIHRESNQLFIGPYAISAEGVVRVIDIKRLVGRLTAIARHLKDPASWVYYYDMEGKLYEVNVQTLEVNKLFEKPVPGWHGKGAYTGQGKLIIANNGEEKPRLLSYKPLLVGGPPTNEEEIGVLAEWDGIDWILVERKQFTEVTGPGGIYGAPDEESPIWSIGWDKASVILKLRDNGQWFTFRLPTSSHTYDHRGGWYSEWRRIREVLPGKVLMDMNGMLFDFPKGFNSSNTGGIKPIATHLRMINDFCEWNGKLVFASNDTSIMKNKPAGQAQSNLWFGEYEELRNFGPRFGVGGPWLNDELGAGEPSDPFLLNGFDKKIVHLSHTALVEVDFTLEVDHEGNGNWEQYRVITVPASGFQYHIFPNEFNANWIRFKVNKACKASAYLHLQGADLDTKKQIVIFSSLANIDSDTAWCAGIIRPANHNRNLQFLRQFIGQQGKVEEEYYEVTDKMEFQKVDSRAKDVKKYAKIKKEFSIDEASVILKYKGQRYRLPKGHQDYDAPFSIGWPRAIRECITERNMVNLHGTFYESGWESGIPKIKPVCTHNKKIMDFCTWRGLLVIAGTNLGANPDGNYFGAGDIGLWFGSIDDLWKFGKPVGIGGPWHATRVKAHKPSDPYLMTGYDKKQVELTHDSTTEVLFKIEIDVDYNGWKIYKDFLVPAGEKVIHEFPDGFMAHWVRVSVNKKCTASAIFTYS